MINIDPIPALRISISDFAHALAHQSDSSIDDAQLHTDSLLDLIPADMRNDPDYDDLPAALIPPTDSLDLDIFNALRDAYTALLNSRY